MTAAVTSVAARAALALVVGLGAVPLQAQDSEPMSAIDWLSQSVRIVDPRGPDPEAPIADSAATPQITVTALDHTSPDTVGLLGPDVTGLPRSLWAKSPQDTLVMLVQAERVDTLPAIQDLIVTLMLAEADAPLDARPDGALFLARIDKLLDLGVLDPAQAMLQEAGPETPALFRRWFDVALLSGSENDACALMRERPDIAPTFPARIFCLARTGDWMAAALTLNTARVLGDVTAEEDALVSRFLDPELFEDMNPMGPPSRISPLVFRMLEAIGEAMPTASLPRAFSHADLRSTTGWKSQIEAAERLARNGGISENVLLGFYTARRPAASGGVWDRAAAMQRFDAALQEGDNRAIATTLPAAWEAMRAVRTEVPFAKLFGKELSELPLRDDIAALVFRIGLLSPDYESIAQAHTPTDAVERFLQAVALGDVSQVAAPDPFANAIHAAFDGAPVPEPMASQITEGKLGEALLRAISAFNDGMTGDAGAITDSIAVLRAVGLEDVARRAALQYLLLDRPS